MKVNIKDFQLGYDVKGEGLPIILLHGWGANRYTWEYVYNHLAQNFKVYRLDLPGFGETKINQSYSVIEVAEIVHDFVMKMSINNPIIIGHSYGGRIAIVYASNYKCRKLILVDSAGIKQKLSIRKKVKIILYKISKKFNFKLKMGSTDFRDAEGVLKSMLVKTVNQDLKDYMKNIDIETLLIYGANDDVTPVKQAKEMNSIIKNSGLVVMEECGHFCYLDRKTYFCLIVDTFLQRDIVND